MFAGGQYVVLGMIPTALGWVGAVMLIVKHRWLRGVTSRLATVGRMALTNYLAQTVICTTLFYGHGFGLFGALDRVQQLAVVGGVWALQLYVSPIWMRHFRFGPAEWVWRTLTYWKVQPMLRVPIPRTG